MAYKDILVYLDPTPASRTRLGMACRSPSPTALTSPASTPRRTRPFWATGATRRRASRPSSTRRCRRRGQRRVSCRRAARKTRVGGTDRSRRSRDRPLAVDADAQAHPCRPARRGHQALRRAGAGRADRLGRRRLGQDHRRRLERRPRGAARGARCAAPAQARAEGDRLRLLARDQRPARGRRPPGRPSWRDTA